MSPRYRLWEVFRSPLLSLFILIRNEDPGLIGRLELKMFHCAESVLHRLNESGNKCCCFWNNGGSLCIFQQVGLCGRKGTLNLQPFTACLKIGFNELCNYLATCCSPSSPHPLQTACHPSLLLNEVVNDARPAKMPTQRKQEAGIGKKIYHLEFWGKEREAEEWSETEKLFKTQNSEAHLPVCYTIPYTKYNVFKCDRECLWGENDGFACYKWNHHFQWRFRLADMCLTVSQ